MSLSLLDLLSCSLAVVVILLVIALNTGQGSNDATDQAIVVEILVYGSNDITDNKSIELSWKGMSEQLYVENTGLSYKLRSDSVLLDSVGISTSIIPDMPIPDTDIGGITYKRCMQMSFDVFSKAKGVNISIKVLSNFGDENTQIICRMANAQSRNGWTKQEEIYPVGYPFTLNLSCTGSGAKLTIEDSRNVTSTVQLTNK